jgi:serine/threonine protein kinase
VRYPSEPPQSVISINDGIEGQDVGSGCSSVVKTIDNCAHTQRRALKIYHHIVGYEKFLQRERNILLKLYHPLIVSIDDFVAEAEGEGESDRIVLEYVPNGTLETALSGLRENKTSFLTDDTTKTIIIVGIVLGMRFVHSRHFVHRNLNPSHILIDNNMRIRLTGFSHSCCIESNDMMEDNCDFPEYRAQSLTGMNSCRYEADVYSFGVILREMCVWNSTLPHLAIPHIIRPEVGSLICKCLSMKELERPSFDEIFKTLENLDFKITPNVVSSIVQKFVSDIIREEATLTPQDADCSPT